MFGIDWVAVMKIVGLDIMLGGDNAVVIALACASLPVALRTRAVLFGTAGAIVMRALLLLVASYVIAIPAVKLIAGAYLLYVGWKLLMDNSGEDPHIKQSNTIWAAVWVIVMADLMMSLDNVLAVTAASQSAGEHATLYAVAGILLSIPIIVVGAVGITKLMDRFPIIIWVGAGLLGWVGMEMMISDNITIGILGHHEGAMEIAYKVAGFVAVWFGALGAQHFRRRRTHKAKAAS